jgi:hypothetical protein
VPTNHHRYAITETADIKGALEVARRRWPQLAHKPNALIRQLIFAGQRAVEVDQQAVDRAREEAIEATKGGLAGVFGPGYLDELRSDWPQ